MKKTMISIGYALGVILLIGLTVFFCLQDSSSGTKSPTLGTGGGEENPTPPPENPPIPDELNILSPETESFKTEDSSFTFQGTVSGNSALLLNGEKILPDKEQHFEKKVELQYGDNTFFFTLGSISKTFHIHRRYIVLSDFTPNTSKTYSAGAKMDVSATARQGATVTATFNGKTITLTQSANTKDGFATFIGSFTMPSGHYVDQNLGKIMFKASHNGWSESFSSENITCKRENTVVDSNPSVTPSGGPYINVGSGIICEVVDYQAETFNGKDTTDKSRPYNNYLPAGTVDYCSSVLRPLSGKQQLVTLRCGRQVYTTKRRSPYTDYYTVTKQYVGTLPDHNELNVSAFEIDGHHTILTLDTMWKAPFLFELGSQTYNSDFSVSNITFSYVDIRFCYATIFEGDIVIGVDHPLFSSVQVIKNESDYILRLHLKKQGAFYGWDAYYDENDQLCFAFLNPTKVEAAETEYGADLSGIVILIDVGHGGSTDPGTSGLGSSEDCEKKWNLILAKAIRDELENLGATVYMTRTDDTGMADTAKMKMLQDLKPDYCIAIHHDGNSTSSLNGFGSFYYHAYSKAAAEFMKNANASLTVGGSKVYKNTNLRWHYYFMGRCSVCPVVLAENGYMTNWHDFNNITNMTVNNAKAKAITKGIVDYFLSIQ